MALGSSAMNMIFDGVNICSKFNLMIGDLESGNTTYAKNHSDFNMATDKTSYDRMNHIVKMEYDSTPIEYKIKLFHSCGRENEPFTKNEIEQINRLFVRNTNDYYKMQLIDEDFSNCYCLCKCTSFEKILIGNIIRGLQITIKLATPYWYSMDEISVSWEVENDTIRKLIDYGGMPYERTYPDISIKILSNGKFSFKNNMTGKTFEINNCISGEIITIKGSTFEMKSNIRNYTDLFNNFNCIFPYITNTYETTENVFTFNGCNAIITMSYRPNRLTGA